MKYIFLLVFFCFNICLAEPLYKSSLINFKKIESSIDPLNYSFAVIGDTHIDSTKQNYVFKKALRRMKKEKVSFLLHCGDLVPKATEENFKEYRSIIKKYYNTLPIFSVMGNHDNDWNSKYIKDLYEKYAGPLNYTLRFPDLKLSITGIDNSNYFLLSSQINMIKNNSKEGYNNFAFMHIPPRLIVPWESMLRWTFTLNQDRLLNLKNIDTLFFGHLHLSYVNVYKNLDFIISGGGGGILNKFYVSDLAFYHFVVVNVKNGVVSYKIIKL